MRIQHNIMAMNAFRNYNTNTAALGRNLEKLSSGYKINRAGDDAAGLAISEKMRAQISGLKQAQSNVKDGISLVKTAEGALQEVQDMLNRMTTLATQSANGTYDNDVDRNNLQKEVKALAEEIDRIADSSNFNGQKLLNGELDSKAEFVSAAGTAAIDTKAIELQDGQAASAATAATGSVTVATGNALIGEDLTAMQLASAGNAKLTDLFTVTVNGSAATNTAVAATNVVALTAKTKGALSDDLIAELKGKGFEITNGNDTGSGSAATKATYKLEIDLTKVAGGDTFTIDGKTFEFVTDGGDAKTGNIKIDITGLDSAVAGTTGKGQLGMAEKIQTAVNGALGTSLTSSAAVAGDIAGGKYTLNLTAKTAGADGNDGEVRVVETNTNAVKGTYTPGKAEGAGKEGKFAQVAYKVDLSKLAVGDKIKINNTEIEIVKDEDADFNGGKLTLAQAQDANTLISAFETNTANPYDSGKIAYDSTNKQFVITNINTTDKASVFAGAAGKLTFTPKTAPTGATTTNGAPLTLQIGDTADDYNQLKVEIGDMHTKALGVDVDSINVKTQEDAAKAVEVIKNAINTVSSTRGDLGAIQNRLEHTTNNLAIMTENIQDAESTIRDVDIADEMTAYTKNNILLQSAQAMLAQANQMPQGVLQLLQ